MSNKVSKNRREKSNRNKGLFISVAAIFVLIILSTYKTPVFQNELNGQIMGVLEIHNKSELKLVATVRLDNGIQVLATIPSELQKRNDTKAMLIEGISIFGHKTYEVVSYQK